MKVGLIYSIGKSGLWLLMQRVHYATCRRPPSVNKDNNSHVAYSVCEGFPERVAMELSRTRQKNKSGGFHYCTIAPVCAYYNVTFKTPFLPSFHVTFFIKPTRFVEQLPLHPVPYS